MVLTQVTYSHIQSIDFYINQKRMVMLTQKIAFFKYPYFFAKTVSFNSCGSLIVTYLYNKVFYTLYSLCNWRLLVSADLSNSKFLVFFISEVNLNMRPIKLLITFLLYFVKRKTSEELVVEHSRNYHLLDDQDKWDKLFGHWNKLHRERRATEYLTNEKIRSYVNSFRPAFEAASTAIKALIKNCVLTGRIKSTASIAEKVKRKGVTMEDLTDIIGFRLTCQTVDMCLDGLSLFESGHPKFETLEKECYGMCPGKDKYRDTGYRRIHLILQIKPENKTFELQIGTPYTNMWSDWNHDFIYKGPTYIAQDQDAQNYSMALAEYFWKLDEV